MKSKLKDKATVMKHKSHLLKTWNQVANSYGKTSAKKNIRNVFFVNFVQDKG
jgi:hypothetical protein